MIADPTISQTYRQIRPYLFSVAYRMTGSASDAEDLVQDAWMRYLDAGSPAVESLRAYLTSIVSRLSINYLKSARVRRETYTGPWLPEPVPTSVALGDPASTLEQREAVSMALLALMERLTPEQRVVYVLREGLGLPYEEIAASLDKTPTACRQVFRRARMRLGGAPRPTIAPCDDHRRLVECFIDAVQAGDVTRIAEMLADDVVWVDDGGADRVTIRRPVVGVDRVSRGAAGQARKNAEAHRRLTIEFLDVNGAPAVLFHDRGSVQRVFAFDVRDGKIAGIRSVLNPTKLRYLDRFLRVDRS